VKPASRISRQSRWGLLTLGAFHQANHAVEETFAGVGGYTHNEPVGQQARPAGDGAAIPAGFAMTGALSPVTALSSTEAIPSMISPSTGRMSLVSTRKMSPLCKLAEVTSSYLAWRSWRGNFLAWVVCGSCAALRPGPCRALRHRLGEVGEQHGEPQPERHRADETGRRLALAEERLYE